MQNTEAELLKALLSWLFSPARLQLMLALYSPHADSSCQVGAQPDCIEVADLGPCSCSCSMLNEALDVHC